MADFETNLVTIAKGRFGKDVREAIYDTIKELYTVGSGYTPTSKSPLIDTSDGNIKGIRVRAHSTQNGTPAPNNPVDIVDASKVITTHNGSETDYKSSSITLNAVIFASVDDVADEIVIDAKTRRGIFYKRVTRNTFKNSITEKWREYISATNQIFILETPNPKPDYTKHIYSDRFVYGIPAPLITTGGKIYCAPTDEVWLVFPANTFTNIDAFKSWLETNNVVVEYALKNPSERILSEEQVDEILSLKTFEGTTYVDAETDVEITYSIGWKTYIDNADAEINERIDELASNPSPSLVLTNPSPLPCTDGKKILGIDVLGKSTQNISPNVFPYSIAQFRTKLVNNQGSGLNNTTDTLEVGVGYGAQYKGYFTKMSTLTELSFLVGKTVTISFDAKATTAGKIAFFNESSSLTVNVTTDWTRCTVTRVLNADSYITLYGGVMANNATTDQTVWIKNIQFEEGSVATPYTPYTGTPTPTNPIPIVDADGEVVAHTKNLFNKDDASQVLDAFIDTSANTINKSTVHKSVAIPCKPNTTYTVSREVGTRFTVAYTTSEPIVGASVYGAITNNTASAITITTGADAKYLVARITNSGDVTLDKVQIEEGTTATAYVPYASNSVNLGTLRSVGNVADECVVADGVGTKTVCVGMTTIGALDWKTSSSGNGRFYADIADGSAYTNPICSTYKYSSTAYEENTISSSKKSSSEDTLRIYVGDTRYTSASEFKSAMSNAVIYYALYTPIETTLTAEEVAAVRQLMTYKGTTIIESEMEIKSVTYPGDVKAYVDGKTDYSYMDTIIGRWLNEGDLHRMVIQTTTPSALNASILVSNLVKPSLHNIKRFDGTIVASPYVDGLNMYINNDYHIATFINQDGVMMNISNNIYANKPCEIIVEYTLKDSAPAAASVMSLDEEGDE